jgi:hypothetical protein
VSYGVVGRRIECGYTWHSKIWFAISYTVSFLFTAVSGRHNMSNGQTSANFERLVAMELEYVMC